MRESICLFGDSFYFCKDDRKKNRHCVSTTHFVWGCSYYFPQLLATRWNTLIFQKYCKMVNDYETTIRVKVSWALVSTPQTKFEWKFIVTNMLGTWNQLNVWYKQCGYKLSGYKRCGYKMSRYKLSGLKLKR